MTKLNNEKKDLDKKLPEHDMNMKSSNSKLITYGACAALISISLMYSEVLAATLDQQLEKVGTLTSGRLKTVGISFATIAGAITAIIKSSPLLAVTIVGIGGGLAYYLDWIAGGMTLGN